MSIMRTTSDGPKNQKKNAADGDGEFVEPTQNRKAGAVVPARSPLPARAKRNPNPAGPDMPAPRAARRSGAELSEATTRKALIAVRLAELEEAKIKAITEMELLSDEEAENEANIDPLADVQMMPTSQFAALGGALGDSPHSSDVEDIPIDDQTFCDIADLDKDYETVVAERKKNRDRELLEKVLKASDLAAVNNNRLLTCFRGRRKRTLRRARLEPPSTRPKKRSRTKSARTRRE